MGVSTHILDLTAGRPAMDVPVSLARRDEEGWTVLSSSDARTDADGRCRTLLPAGERLVPGVYRVRFDTRVYYDSQRISGLYPFVEITFEVRDGGVEAEAQHYHIPLLLTANGYTTYRGT